MDTRYPLLVGALTLVGVLPPVLPSAAQVATPTPDASPGVQVEALVGTPSLPVLPPDTSLTVQRITYQPGATSELAYPGPVLYYVESGLLAVPFSPGGGRAILDAGDEPPRPRPSGTGGEVVLTAGQAILANSGDLGPTRNPGDEPAVVLAVLLVPEALDEGEADTKVLTAVPAEDATPAVQAP
jgi:hypothetical protein